MVCVDATFAIMGIFLGWTPARLVEKHVKEKPIITHVKFRQLMVQIGAVQQTSRNEIVFDTFVLEGVVDDFDLLEVLECEAYKLERAFAAVEGYY